MKNFGSISLIAAVIFLPLCLLFSVSIASIRIAHADEASDLQSKIDQRNTDIQALEKEIAGYQAQITSLSGEEASLADTIKALILNEKKLQADIAVTQDKIDATNLRIQQLSSQIGSTQDTIVDNTRFVMASFKTMNETGGQSLPEIFLASQSLSDAWNGVARLSILQESIQDHIKELTRAKNKLVDNRTATERAKADLISLQRQLQDQQKAIIATRSEKSSLLSQTKNSESSYRKLVAQKQALKDAFQQELGQYEAQLKLVVNRANLPASGSGALLWPLDKIIITQYFGNTPFSTANPQVYKGKGHDGVDFAASIGTPVKAARSGVVTGVANTDIVAGCYSFGKWIMVKHNDGLSTLYAHLSVQSVAVGDNVSTGEVIGYSGNTGYTTGPHLHFGVYATDGTEIKLFTNSINCKGATIPIAVQSAYLNPLSYLPELSR
jgi:murein DD-endopeptidase MepM/ murein hydrolase activator NlpD